MTGCFLRKAMTGQKARFPDKEMTYSGQEPDNQQYLALDAIYIHSCPYVRIHTPHRATLAFSLCHVEWEIRITY